MERNRASGPAKNAVELIAGGAFLVICAIASITGIEFWPTGILLVGAYLAGIVYGAA